MILLLGALTIGCVGTTGEQQLSRSDLSTRSLGAAVSRSRTVNGITTTVRVVQNDRSPSNKEHGGPADKIARPETSIEQLTIIVSLAPDGKQYKRDVMFATARNASEFREHAFDLNFNWPDKVRLHCDSSTYAPVLSTLENTYGLTKDRNAVLVFVPGSKNDPAFYRSEEFDIAIDNDVLGIGTQHFKFNRKDIERAFAQSTKS